MKQIIKLLMVMLMLGGVACTTNDLDGGNQDNNDTNELHNQIWYTATEKVTPYNTNAFGATIASNVWNETTGEGVITFDGEVTSIGDDAFAYCSSLASITIPEGVTSIGVLAFCGCLNLASVTLPDSVTSIGAHAFANCRSLASITIPEGVTSIENNAFYNCESLASITIPEGVTSIGDNAFCGCSSLASISIPDSVTSIGKGAFWSCSSLTSITIPDSVTSIEDFAFSGCSSLAEVYCKPITPPSGGYAMFYDNASERKIYVPAESVEAYKTDWSNYADAIEGYDFE